MRQELWIPGPLPGVNEIIAAAKGARGTGRVYWALKQRWTNAVALLAKAARLQPIPSARFAFVWREKTRQRNPDNIAGGHKFVFDGLVEAGILANDGWTEVQGWTDTFEVSKSPGVLVVIDS